MKETLINYSNRKSVNKETKCILLKQKNYVPQQVIAPGIGCNLQIVGCRNHET